jgi:hypothetical protein
MSEVGPSYSCEGSPQAVRIPENEVEGEKRGGPMAIKKLRGKSKSKDFLPTISSASSAPSTSSASCVSSSPPRKEKREKKKPTSASPSKHKKSEQFMVESSIDNTTKVFFSTLPEPSPPRHRKNSIDTVQQDQLQQLHHQSQQTQQERILTSPREFANMMDSPNSTESLSDISPLPDTNPSLSSEEVSPGGTPFASPRVFVQQSPRGQSPQKHFTGTSEILFPVTEGDPRFTRRGSDASSKPPRPSPTRGPPSKPKRPNPVSVSEACTSIVSSSQATTATSMFITPASPLSLKTPPLPLPLSYSSPSSSSSLASSPSSSPTSTPEGSTTESDSNREERIRRMNIVRQLSSPNLSNKEIETMSTLKSSEAFKSSTVGTKSAKRMQVGPAVSQLDSVKMKLNLKLLLQQPPSPPGTSPRKVGSSPRKGKGSGGAGNGGGTGAGVASGGKVYIAASPYTGTDGHELSFNQGEEIIFKSCDENGWVLGQIGDDIGWFPSSCLKDFKPNSGKFLLPVEDSSITQQKGVTMKKLDTFLPTRPGKKQLLERNIIEGGQVTPRGTFQQSSEKQHKVEVLNKLLGNRRAGKLPFFLFYFRSPYPLLSSLPSSHCTGSKWFTFFYSRKRRTSTFV